MNEAMLAATEKRQSYAKVIADSISESGDRLTTFEVCFNRFVLAEFNTHRVFSRNSASSRAIPLTKQIHKVEHTPALPVVWAAEQKGMQGGDEVDSTDEAEKAWLNAADDAVIGARRLGALGVHKSIANRLLEPFQMHTVVVTATAWGNFFDLRCSPLAQPEIKVAADAMREAFIASTPRELGQGFWHLPYLMPGEITEIEDHGLDPRGISSARVARVSYETHAGVRDFGKDWRLYKMLCENGHASPLEQVATPAPDNQHDVEVNSYDMYGKVDGTKTIIVPKYGNLLGYHQHRFDVEVARGYQSYA